MNEVKPQSPPRRRPKLDARLATLMELGLEVVAPDELERFESRASGTSDGDRLLRDGPVSFYRGALLRKSRLEVALPQGTAGSVRRTEAPPSIPIFLSTTTADALDRLAASGIRLVTRARTIATADVLLSQISMLEDDDSVLAIEWTGAFRPLGAGLSGQASCSPCAAAGIEPQRLVGLDGRGCVVGVVDVEGIDLYHPSFIDNRCRTHVYSVWDQRAAVTPGAFLGDEETGPGGLGVVHRHEAIELEISPSQLIRGSIVDHHPIKGSHGTRTASLAVGLGEERPDARGVAPGARLVFVNTFGSGAGALGAMTELADAIGFVLNEADRLGAPCVVNVSLGDNLGPRDGTSPVERFIDDLLETEGRAIVIAAGNAHRDRRHAEVTLGPGKSARLGLRVSPRNTERAVVEIWYDAAGGATLSLDIEPPGEAGCSGTIEADGVPRAFDTGSTRVLVISIARCPGPADGSRTNAVIRIELAAIEEGGHLLAGTWGFHVRAEGPGLTAHAWVDHRYAHWETPSDTLTLTTPATARKALVVGAYNPATGTAASFSGRGVDRRGALRPDLLATGVSLVTAWAASHVRYVDTSSGTSFAAPLVAGVAALLFQRAGEKISSDRLRRELMTLTGASAGSEPKLWAASLSPVRVAPAVERCAGAEAARASASAAEPTRQGRSYPSVRPRDAAQIIQGHYLVRSLGEQIASVLVMRGDYPDASIEHWLLEPSFQPPSAERPDTLLEIEYIGRPIELEHFLAAAAEGARYVRAACESSSLAAERAGITRRTSPSMVEGLSQQTRSKRAMTAKNYMRPLDRTQIIQGKYLLHQGETEVGQLLVIDEAPGVSAEHWLLYRAYRWPSEANPNQELRFEYKGSIIPLTEFLSGVPVDTTYVLANCEQQTLP